MHEALLLSLKATGFRVPVRGVLLSLGPKSEKFSFADEAAIIRNELGLPIYATVGTADMLRELGIEAHVVAKSAEQDHSAVELIRAGEVDLVINIPREYDQQGRPDGYWIRRAAIDNAVPLVTDLQLARAVVEMLRQTRGKTFEPAAMGEWVRTR